MAAPDPKKTLDKRSSRQPGPGARELKPASRREWTNGVGHTVRVVEYR